MIVIVFIAIQIGINAYLYRTLASGIGRDSWLAGGFMAFCLLALIAALLMERTKLLKSSLLVSKIGYNWMGIGFILASIALAFDAAQWVFPRLSDATALTATLSLGSLLSIWGFASACRINIRRVLLKTDKINRPLILVQLSDLHLGDSSTLPRLQSVVETVNQLKPDVIVSTGDLFDGYLPLMGPYVDALRQLEAPLGKFAVSGNHEVYAGLEESMELTRRSGFKVLRNESVDIEDSVTLVGIEDPAAPNQESREAVVEQCFNNAHSERFTIFLNHRPSIRPERFDLFDLQLSGHTHGGQIFPFHLLSKLAYQAKPGLTEIAPETFLYLSRGTGSWGPQLRVFAPPEITCFAIGPKLEQKTL